MAIVVGAVLAGSGCFLMVRMLYLMFVRLSDWMALLARSTAPQGCRAAGAVP
ncbi:hypothetical protein [Actinomadura sp. 6K520]|uniref:hypothetical protein n=1 Tax=Actinomadura sp. 6K520 TaxID=2530364 RepID=UPI0014050473|nr:hypothetical protein [Actinomadura sp. 6K520]